MSDTGNHQQLCQGRGLLGRDTAAGAREGKVNLSGVSVTRPPISPQDKNLAMGCGEPPVRCGDLGTGTATVSPWASAVQSILLRSGDGGFSSNSSQGPIND